MVARTEGAIDGADVVVAVVAAAALKSIVAADVGVAAIGAAHVAVPAVAAADIVAAGVARADIAVGEPGKRLAVTPAAGVLRTGGRDAGGGDQRRCRQCQYPHVPDPLLCWPDWNGAVPRG